MPPPNLPAREQRRILQGKQICYQTLLTALASLRNLTCKSRVAVLKCPEWTEAFGVCDRPSVGEFKT
eukprot:5615995-Pyramimonas_sp.AAC.1